MSINTKRNVATCIVCLHKRASLHDLFCPDCGEDLVPARVPKQPCEGRNCQGEPCPNFARQGEHLCASCRTFYQGGKNGHS